MWKQDQQENLADLGRESQEGGEVTLGVTVTTCPEALHLRFSQQMLRCMDGWADGQLDGWVDSEMLKMLRGKLKKTSYNSSWQTGKVNKCQ